MGTSSHRWRGSSTPSSRRNHGDDVASIAWGARNLISTQIVALERHDACFAHRRLELRTIPGLDAKGLALVVVQLDARRRRPPEDVPALGHAREARQTDALERDVLEQTLDGLEGVVLRQGALEAQPEAFQRPAECIV